MKKIYTLFFLLAFAFWGKAQNNEQDIAMNLVRSNSAALGLSEADLANSGISSTYVIPGTDIRMVYLQQTWKAMPVFNKLQTLAFKNGQLVSAAGDRIAGMEQLANPESGIPAISAATAVQTAATEAGITSSIPSLVPLSVLNNGRLYNFGNLGISGVAVTATLLWAPDETGKVQLVWQIEVAPKNTSDHWLIRVNANNNTVLNKNNYTVYCNWSKTDQACNEHNHFTNQAAPMPPRHPYHRHNKRHRSHS